MCLFLCGTSIVQEQMEFHKTCTFFMVSHHRVMKSLHFLWNFYHRDFVNPVYNMRAKFSMKKSSCTFLYIQNHIKQISSVPKPTKRGKYYFAHVNFIQLKNFVELYIDFYRNIMKLMFLSLLLTETRKKSITNVSFLSKMSLKNSTKNVLVYFLL